MAQDFVSTNYRITTDIIRTALDDIGIVAIHGEIKDSFAAFLEVNKRCYVILFL